MPYYTILIDDEQPLPAKSDKKYGRTAEGDLIVNGRSQWKTKRSARNHAIEYRDKYDRDAWVEYNQ